MNCDINNLTYGQIKELTALFQGSVQGVASPSAHPMVGKHVIVRSYASGVHFGVLKACSGKEVTLTESRRIYTWEGAFTLSAVSQEGVKTAKMPCPVPEIYLPDCCEVIPCSDRAVKSLTAIKEHKV